MSKKKKKEKETHNNTHKMTSTRSEHVKYLHFFLLKTDYTHTVSRDNIQIRKKKAFV